MAQPSWRRRPTDKDITNAFFDHDPRNQTPQPKPYPLANTLKEGLNRSHCHRPLHDRWWFILAELLVLIAGVLTVCSAAGCFDK